MLNWFQHPIKIGKQACETLNQVQRDARTSNRLDIIIFKEITFLAPKLSFLKR